jgi:rhodanese-related sulfurtransferase
MAALLTMAAIGLIGCDGASAPSSSSSVRDISAGELEALLASEEAPIVIDVRTGDEYENGHIPGSINIPLDELSARMSELSEHSPIVCVCSSGFRSARAAEMLLDADFNTVYNLKGGINSASIS